MHSLAPETGLPSVLPATVVRHLEGGDDARRQGLWEDALRLYHEAMWALRRENTSPFALLAVYLRIGDVYLLLAGQPEIARGYYEAAIPSALDDQARGAILLRLGETYRRDEESVTYFAEAAKLIEKAGDPALEAWVQFRLRQKDSNRAPENRAGILRLAIAALAARQHPHLPDELTQVARDTALWFAALENQTDLVDELCPSMASDTSPAARASNLRRLASAHHAAGRQLEAVRLLREEMTIWETVSGRTDEFLSCVAALSYHLLSTGRSVEARELVLASLARYPHLPTPVMLLYRLCKTWQGQREEAGAEWCLRLVDALIGALCVDRRDALKPQDMLRLFGIAERTLSLSGKQGAFRAALISRLDDLSAAGYGAVLTPDDGRTGLIAPPPPADLRTWRPVNTPESAAADGFVLTSTPLQGFSHMNMPRWVRSTIGDFAIEATLPSAERVQQAIDQCRATLGAGRIEETAVGGGGLLLIAGRCDAIRLCAHVSEPGEVFLESRLDGSRETHMRRYVGETAVRLRLEKVGRELRGYAGPIDGPLFASGSLTIPSWQDVEVGVYGEGVNDLYPSLVKHLRTEVRDLRFAGLTEKARPGDAVAELPEPGPTVAVPGFISEGRTGPHVLSQIRTAAVAELPVLITGPTGTGKDLVARAIHALSDRQNGPLVPVNCAAIAADLLERELFGHVLGAFTGAVEDRPGLFEAADGGTLFLDEIADASPQVQASLLRAVEEGALRRVGDQGLRSVNVRIVAATNRDLGSLCAAGVFRQDLYFRLRGLEIDLPPLRKRRDEIPYLVLHFLREWSTLNGCPTPDVTVRALDLLRDYDWPGNVRELRMEVTQAATAAHAGKILDTCLSARVRADRPAPSAGNATNEERLRAALRASGGNVTAAARDLGISRNSIYRWMRRYGLRDGPQSS